MCKLPRCREEADGGGVNEIRSEELSSWTSREMFKLYSHNEGGEAGQDCQEIVMLAWSSW